eukprot:scaffold291507_cov56-Attheya_sp.AAC.4
MELRGHPCEKPSSMSSTCAVPSGSVIHTFIAFWYILSKIDSNSGKWRRRMLRHCRRDMLLNMFTKSKESSTL